MSLSPKVTQANDRAFLDRILSEPSPRGLSQLRQQARARLAELNVPSRREEEWRFTDLTPLLQYRFQPAPAAAQAKISRLWPEAARSRLVFVDGRYVAALSDVSGLPEGVYAGPLAGADPGLVAGHLSGGEEVFATLNTVYFQDAAIVVIPDNLQLAEPIHVLVLATDPGHPTLVQPRCLVIARAGSTATLVEEFSGDGIHFTNSVTEIEVEANARLAHIRLQLEGSEAFHIGKTVVWQQRDSYYRCNAVSLGGRLARHTLALSQIGEQASSVLHGLTQISGQQTSDTHTTLDHQAPHGSSSQIHRCILDDSAHAVFNGRVLVQQAAQLTDAAQSNRNLLLSPKARVDTKPQLEIFADDVKCSHGATVSQLEADEVFYLQSRGIDSASARRILTYAFAIEGIESISLRSIRTWLQQVIQPAL